MSETLCLQGTRRGEQLEVRVIPESEAAIQVSLGYHDGRSVLELRNGGPFPLWYRTFRGSLGPQPLLPGHATRVSQPGPADEVTLIDLRVAPPPSPMFREEAPVAPERPRPVPRGAWVALSGFFSVRHAGQTEINESLRSNGYSGIGTNHATWGAVCDFGAGRWRGSADVGFDRTRHYTRLRDGREYTLTSLVIGVHAGYDLLQYQLLSVFPVLGFAGGDWGVFYDPADPPMLTDQLGAYPGNTRVHRVFAALLPAIGIEERLPVFDLNRDSIFLLLGMRIGFAQQISQGSWTYWDEELPDITGGPRPNGSGAFFRMSLGLGGGSVRGTR